MVAERTRVRPASEGIGAEDVAATLAPALIAPGLFALTLLTHNSAVVFVLTAGLLLVMDGRRTLWHRVLAAGVMVGGAITPWLVIRYAYQQGQSHQLTAAYCPPYEYFFHTLIGLGDFLLTSSPALLLPRAILGTAFFLGLIVLLLRRHAWALPRASYHAVVFLCVSYALLFLIFNLTWIDSGLYGRFLWFMPLIAVPVFFRAARAQPVLLAVLLLLFLGPSGFRMVKWTTLQSFVIPLPADARAPADIDIRPWYFLSGKPTREIPAGYRAVTPPSFPWMPRWHALTAPEQDRSSVTLGAAP